MTSTKGVTAAEVATAVYGSADRNSVEKARRKLDRLVNENKIHRSGGSRGGAKGQGSALYLGVASRSKDIP